MVQRWRFYVGLAVAGLLLAVYVVSAVGNICVPVAGGGCQPPVVGGEGGIDIFGAFGAILAGIVDALAVVANHVIDLLPVMPDLGLPDLSGLVVGYSFLNTYLPLSEAAAGFGLWLTAATAGFWFKLGEAIWHLIPKPLAGT